MYRRILMPKAVLRAALIGAVALPFFLGGCATPGGKQSIRGGQAYGVVEGTFRGRWWNHYERGRSYLDGGFYAEAEADLQKALAHRAEDQRWARTYGLHFLPEYFPNRELGIVLFHTGRLEEAESRLLTSLDQTPSALAAHFLERVRADRVTQSGADASPPRIALLAPQPESPLGALRGSVTLRVTDDTYVRAVRVNGQAQPVYRAEREIEVTTEVAIASGENLVEVEAEDVAGHMATETFVLRGDADGPAVSFDAGIVLPGVVRGVAADPAGVAAITVAGINAELEAVGGATRFSVEVPRSAMQAPVLFEARDGFGNATSGRVPVNTVVAIDSPVDAAFAAAPRVVVAEGLEAGWIGGKLAWVRVAQNAGNDAPRLLLVNLAEGQRYLMDEIVVDLEIRADAPLATLELNGRPVDGLIPGRSEQHLTRRVALGALGPNTIAAAFTDTQGGKGSASVTVERAPTAVEEVENRLRVALLGNLWEGAAPKLDDEAGFVAQELTRVLYERGRFDLIARDALPRVLEERELQSVLGAPGGASSMAQIIPADLFVIGKVRRSGDTVEIVLQAVSARTSKIIGYSDVAGLADSLEHLRGLVSDLALRFEQEFPRVRGEVVDVRSAARCYSTLGGLDRIRAGMPCLVFRLGPEIRHPQTGALLGHPTDIIAEGTLEEIRKELSAVALEGPGATVQVHDFVITK